MTEVTCIWDAKAILGESPVWVAREQTLYWVDIQGCCLFQFNPETNGNSELAIRIPNNQHCSEGIRAVHRHLCQWIRRIGPRFNYVSDGGNARDRSPAESIQ